MSHKTPETRTARILYRGRSFEIDYFIRQGYKETILLVHGLGGAKENYWEACKSDALADHTLIAFDNPGTGGSSYYNDFFLDVDDLTAITSLFIEKLSLTNFILCGTSMGGLTTLLYLEGSGRNKVKGYINIEGNLMPEDCMFSGKVVSYDWDMFQREVFPQTIVDMKKNGNTGYYVIANNLQLNTNVRAYYHYSFQTVSYSATGELLEQYISLDIPRVFIYGEENSGLSYLPKLINGGMHIKAIAGSNHFVFYDNPKELYDVIGNFVDTIK